MKSKPFPTRGFAATLVTPFQHGRTVGDVLTDPLVTEEVKHEVQSRYVEALVAIQDLAVWRFVRASRDFEPERPWRGALLAETAGVRWLIKASNVIVDPWDLHLTLVDPK